MNSMATMHTLFSMFGGERTFGGGGSAMVLSHHLARSHLTLVLRFSGFDFSQNTLFAGHCRRFLPIVRHRFCRFDLHRVCKEFRHCGSMPILYSICITRSYLRSAFCSKNRKVVRQRVPRKMPTYLFAIRESRSAQKLEFFK